jgi:hypothetical protein
MTDTDLFRPAPLVLADIEAIEAEARDPKQRQHKGYVKLLPIQMLQLCALARRGLDVPAGAR